MFAKGFQKNGLDVLYSNKHIKSHSFLKFLKNNEIQAVLQINKRLISRDGWPKNILHLLWLQDYRFNGIDILKILERVTNFIF